MKIKSVTADWIHVPSPEERQHVTDFGRISSFDSTLVRVETECGIVGYGEARPAAGSAGSGLALKTLIEQELGPLIVGEDPRRISRLWDIMYNGSRAHFALARGHVFPILGRRGITICGISGIDIALWDIKGKRCGVPVYSLLGGAFRKSVPAYATGAFRRLSGDRPSYLAEETAAYISEGFSAVKIKIGYGLKDDIATIRAVREAIGPDAGFMIDANHGLDVIESIELARAVADCNIGWFEEPVVPEDLAGYRQIRRSQPIPVAGGETWHTRWGFQRAFAAEAIDIAQPDICGGGGFTEGRKIADMASTAGVRLIPHVWGTGVAIAAALHYLAAIPDTPPRHEPRQPVMEFDRTHNPFRQAVLTKPIDHAGGIVTVPEGPGLGIEINRDALRQYAMQQD